MANSSGFVDPAVKQHYVVIELADNDLYSHHFGDKDDAEKFINESDWKCYMVSVEYEWGGLFRIKSIPYM